MSKIKEYDDAIFKIALKEYLRGWSDIERRHNPSSAVLAEERYARYGIKLPFKIYYDYKMPFGLESAYDLLFWETCQACDVSEHKNLLAELREANIEDLESDYDKERAKLALSFSDKQLIDILDWFRQISYEEMIAEIKRLNPELAHIKTDLKLCLVGKPDVDFIRGVAYGFAPENIEFCVTNTHDDVKGYLEKWHNKKILDFGHYVSPSRLDALLDAEEKIKIIEKQKQIKTGRE